MTDTRKILANRFSKLSRHISALTDYHELIIEMEKTRNIYDPVVFTGLTIIDKAVLDAYLKRFSSVQDYLGDKIFSLLVELTGKNTSRMSEILLQMESEEIIDSLESWIELREQRNALEHDYPAELEEALLDLKKCVKSFSILHACFIRSIGFVKKIYQDFSYETE